MAWQSVAKKPNINRRQRRNIENIFNGGSVSGNKPAIANLASERRRKPISKSGSLMAA
jgi:hypothetical protein